MNQLRAIQQVGSLCFWGVIEGLKKDYVILSDYQFEADKFFPQVTHFWSDDWLSFAPLPRVQPEDTPVLAAQRDYLTGEHDKIIQKLRSTNDFLENTNLKEIVQRGNQRSSLREIHRVAYLVQTITAESLLVPKRAFSLNYADNLTLNSDFICPWKELGSLSSYCRFVKPSAEEVLKAMALKSKGERYEFLKGADELKSEFSVLKDSIGVNFWVNSLKWPGFVNYFRANSSEFGHVYFGNGLQKTDLPFTLN